MLIEYISPNLSYDNLRYEVKLIAIGNKLRYIYKRKLKYNKSNNNT